jgi:hypothetical protein
MRSVVNVLDFLRQIRPTTVRPVPDSVDSRIMKVVQDGGFIRLDRIVAATGLSPMAILASLNRLQSLGWIALARIDDHPGTRIAMPRDVASRRLFDS